MNLAPQTSAAADLLAAVTELGRKGCVKEDPDLLRPFEDALRKAGPSA